MKSYNEALALQREIGDKSGTSLTLINLGDLLNETLGRPDEALPRFREALSLTREEGDRSGEALALNNIGVAYLAKGEFSEAQTYFERALDIREQQKVPQEIADTLHNLGETLGRMGKYDQALARYLKALDARRADGDARTAAMESYSIGTIFDYQGRYGAAVKSKGEALQAFRDLKQRDVWFGEILERRRLQPRARRPRRRGLEEPRRGAGGGARAEELEPGRAGPSLPGGERVLQGRHGERRRDSPARRCRRRRAPPIGRWISGRGSSRRTSRRRRQPTRAAAATLAQIGRRAKSAGLTYLSVYCALQQADALLRAGDHQQARLLAEDDAGEGRDARASRTAGEKRVRPRRRDAPRRERAGPPALHGRAAAPRGDGAGGRQPEDSSSAPT